MHRRRSGGLCARSQQLAERVLQRATCPASEGDAARASAGARVAGFGLASGTVSALQDLVGRIVPAYWGWLESNRGSRRLDMTSAELVEQVLRRVEAWFKSTDDAWTVSEDAPLEFEEVRCRPARVASDGGERRPTTSCGNK